MEDSLVAPGHEGKLIGSFDPANPKPGVYHDISILDYHKVLTGIVSNSYLSKLNECPAKAKVLEDTDTPALILGRATHKYILEGPAFFDEFAVETEKFDGRTKAGKEGKAIFAAANVGKQTLSQDIFQNIQDMNDAVRSNPIAGEYLKDIHTEVTVIFQDNDIILPSGDTVEGTGLFVKSRPDIIPIGKEGVVLDLKTSKDAEHHPFQTAVVRYGYSRQAAIALTGLARVTGIKHDLFGFIVVETEVPYRTEVYVLDDDFLRHGFSEYRRLMNIEKHCRDQNLWPNYAPADLTDLRRAVPHTMMLPGYLSARDGVWERDETR